MICHKLICHILCTVESTCEIVSYIFNAFRRPLTCLLEFFPFPQIFSPYLSQSFRLLVIIFLFFLAHIPVSAQSDFHINFQNECHTLLFILWYEIFCHNGTDEGKPIFFSYGEYLNTNTLTLSFSFCSTQMSDS